ncbi:hypothetical protein M8J77_003117 [Diaphorina citri]|nr:hypothetical protein M8J77_003117 [Diaphorina citri]
MPPVTRAPCVRSCHCDRDKEVSCRNAGFTSVPESLPPNTLKLQGIMYAEIKDESYITPTSACMYLEIR